MHLKFAKVCQIFLLFEGNNRFQNGPFDIVNDLMPKTVHYHNNTTIIITTTFINIPIVREQAALAALLVVAFFPPTELEFGFGLTFGEGFGEGCGVGCELQFRAGLKTGALLG